MISAAKRQRHPADAGREGQAAQLTCVGSGVVGASMHAYLWEVIGTCKLTRTEGPLVKSHIIPRAFMRRASDGPFKECGADGFPRRSYDGWYDGSIVTRIGEDILSILADAAAKCFIARGYTYRGRRSASDLTTLTGGFIPKRVYTITNIDATMLRRFGLSLPWRAAVSRLPPFSRITVPPKRLEDLRQRIIGHGSDSHRQFPVYFGFF